MASCNRERGGKTSWCIFLWERTRLVNNERRLLGGLEFLDSNFLKHPKLYTCPFRLLFSQVLLPLVLSVLPRGCLVLVSRCVKACDLAGVTRASTLPTRLPECHFVSSDLQHGVSRGGTIECGQQAAGSGLQHDWQRLARSSSDSAPHPSGSRRIACSS